MYITFNVMRRLRLITDYLFTGGVGDNPLIVEPEDRADTAHAIAEIEVLKWKGHLD